MYRDIFRDTFLRGSLSWIEILEESSISGCSPCIDVVLFSGSAEPKLVLEFKFILEVMPGATPGLAKAVDLRGGDVPCSNVSVSIVTYCNCRSTTGKLIAVVVTVSYLGRGDSTVIIEMCSSDHVVGKYMISTV